MFGRGGTTARMRGRNDGGAQKRRVLVIVCTLVLMFSLLSLYHGSFFGNRGSKDAVEDTFDPSASGWRANLVKDGAAKGGKANGDGEEDVAVEKDAFAEKIEANEDEPVLDGGLPKAFPVSVTVFCCGSCFVA